MKRILIAAIAGAVVLGLVAVSDVAGKGRETAHDPGLQPGLVETGFVYVSDDAPVEMSTLDRRHYQLTGARTATLTYDGEYVGAAQITCGEARITPYYVCIHHDLVGLSSLPLYCHTDLWDPEPGGGRTPKIKSTNVTMACWDSDYVTQFSFSDTTAAARLKFPTTREFEKFEATIDLSGWPWGYYDTHIVFNGKQLGRFPDYESTDSPDEHSFGLPFTGLRPGE